MNQNISKLFNSILLGSTLFLIASCSKGPEDTGIEFMPDMYYNPAYTAYELSPLFGDSLSAMVPVKGTIPRGYTFFYYPSSNEGYEAAGRDLTNPYIASVENLTEGKRLYDNYCMHCHGSTGEADGSLIETGKFPPPPSYTSGVSSRGGSMSDLTDGKIFHTITYGVNLMGPHASQLNHEERWKITMYVKQLSAAGKTVEAPAE